MPDPEEPVESGEKEPKIETSEKKKRVVNEILETESRYLSSLEALRDIYYQPLHDAATLDVSPLLSEGEIRLVFLNLEDIILVSKELQKQLKKRIEEDLRWDVGDIFIQMVWGFNLYRRYVEGYELSLSRLREAKEKQPKFKEFLLECEQDPKSQNLNLTSLLIMPVQRIPRYRLLLTEALKNTVEGEGDFLPLKEALEKTEEAAAFVNEAIRKRENREAIRKLGKRFPALNEPGVFNPKRQFVKEGCVMKICRKTHKRYLLVLFDDLLIYKGEKDVQKPRLIKLVGVEDKPDTAGYSNAFQITSVKKSFIVIADDAPQKQQWMDAINGILADRKEAGGAAAPVWEHDKESHHCTLCGAKFTLFFRRHHCRSCGKLVCSKCSNGRWDLDVEANARVCNPCYRMLAGNTPNAASSTSTVISRDSVDFNPNNNNNNSNPPTPNSSNSSAVSITRNNSVDIRGSGRFASGSPKPSSPGEEKIDRAIITPPTITGVI